MLTCGCNVWEFAYFAAIHMQRLSHKIHFYDSSTEKKKSPAANFIDVLWASPPTLDQNKLLYKKDVKPW